MGATDPPVVKVNVTLGQAAEWVRVRLYTVAMRKVAEQSFDPRPSGVYDFDLLLKDVKGSDLGNGFYYLVVETQAGRSIGKLLLLR